MAHLDERCRACEMLQDCGGGCTMGRKDGDPYKTEITSVGHDILRAPNHEDR